MKKTGFGRRKEGKREREREWKRRERKGGEEVERKIRMAGG